MRWKICATPAIGWYFQTVEEAGNVRSRACRSAQACNSKCIGARYVALGGVQRDGLTERDADVIDDLEHDEDVRLGRRQEDDHVCHVFLRRETTSQGAHEISAKFLLAGNARVR